MAKRPRYNKAAPSFAQETQPRKSGGLNALMGSAGDYMQAESPRKPKPTGTPAASTPNWDSKAPAKMARQAQAAAPVAAKQTGGGKFPVYAKGSEPAKSFNTAFAQARQAGAKTFEWQGRNYSTKTK